LNIDLEIDKLGKVVQKQEEIFEEAIEVLKSRYKILPDDTVQVILLFRKITEKLDAIFILLENASEKSAESISRDLFENFLYFKYIIDPNGNSDQRARAYHYSYLQDQLHLSELLLSKKEKNLISKLITLEDEKLLEVISKQKNIKDALNREYFKNI